MTKPRLTQSEHTELGSVLAGIRDELQRRATQIANAYPRSGPESLPGRKLKQALEALEQARTALDHAVLGEYPRTAETTDYYPDREDRATVQVPPVWRRRV